MVRNTRARGLSIYNFYIFLGSYLVKKILDTCYSDDLNVNRTRKALEGLRDRYIILLNAIKYLNKVIDKYGGQFEKFLNWLLFTKLIL